MAPLLRGGTGFRYVVMGCRPQRRLEASMLRAYFCQVVHTARESGRERERE
jgi:hypothetical protein